MLPRPTIFISSASRELRSARQLVANALTFLGYEPVWQEIFGTEEGDLRGMLRRQIDQCKGVVQLVGQCSGVLPPATDEEFGRVSYTQYEALYARKRGKKVWYLVLDERFPADPHEPEPEERRRLQASYRNALTEGTDLYHPLASREALEAGVLKLRDELAPLRRGARRWAAGVAALLVLIAVLVVWLLHGQDETDKAVANMTIQVAKGGESLEKIAQRFETLASRGGLVASARTPEEHYHNARVHELGGNFTAARKEYAEYLSANLEALDPWLSYSAMLKASEGKAGAAETLRYFGSKLKPPTVSYQTALALLEEGDTRLTELEALAGTHPDFGPLPWLISQEYSEARRGDQTLADQRSEKQWLEKFRAAQAAGKFQRYFLDKKDAQQWLDTADERWAKLASVPQKVLENPVTLSTLYGNSGWDVTFTLTDFKVTELFYRLDGKGDFRSTGHLPFTNPQTGLPKVNLHVPMPDLSSGRHTVEVKYVDRNGKTNGPYSLSFSTDEELLKQGKWALDSTPGSWLQFKDFDGKVLLYFSHLLSYTAVLKEIRYSLDSDKLDQSFKFKPGTKYGEHDRDEAIFLAVPPDIRYASVQVIYKDGTVSPLRRIVRPK